MTTKRNVVMYPSRMVFAAALRVFEQHPDGHQNHYDTRNKLHIRSALSESVEYDSEHMRRADEMIQYYRGLTFKIIAGQRLTPLNQKLMELASQELISDNEVGAVAYAPQGYQHGKKRQDFDDRVRYARGDLIGTPGDKFFGTVEVLRCIYSHNYNVNFVTAVTESDSVLYFAIKNSVETGAKLNIRGTIKAHRDNQTQLNRVRVLNG